MKHLLRTCAFAKKFVDPVDFDANRYVNTVKHMIVLTKLRNSPVVSIEFYIMLILVCKSNHIQIIREIQSQKHFKNVIKIQRLQIGHHYD